MLTYIKLFNVISDYKRIYKKIKKYIRIYNIETYKDFKKYLRINSVIQNYIKIFKIILKYIAQFSDIWYSIKYQLDNKGGVTLR